MVALAVEAVRDVPEEPLLNSSDHFALTTLIISVFGDVVKWAFRHGTVETRLPWDARSQFAHIQGLLNSFESFSDACNGNFAKILKRDFVFQGKLDERAARHFSCAHVHYTSTNVCYITLTSFDSTLDLRRSRFQSTSFEVPLPDAGSMRITRPSFCKSCISMDVKVTPAFMVMLRNWLV
jgi:hypothetical protein